MLELHRRPDLAPAPGPPAPRPGVPRMNRDRLVALAVAGQISNPLVRAAPYRVGRDGVLRVVPGTGGIALNCRVGDRAVGLAGDHIEPGVALRNEDRATVGGPGAANRALLAYSCVGNRAEVTSGPAAGATGTVTGKHGGINHVLVDFPPEVLRRLRIGDRIQITACGQGLELLDFPGVRALNLAPRLFERWNVRAHRGHLHVPVTHLIPAGIMGSGLGRSDSVLGDTDIQLSDPEVVRRFRLNTLRLGDLVAICPLDYRYGPSFRGGAITVGVVVHSNSHVAGHGPGVTPLLISVDGTLRPVFDPHANIARLLGLRRAIAPAIPPREGELGAWRAASPCSVARPPALTVDDFELDLFTDDLDAFADLAAPPDPIARAQEAVRLAQQRYQAARETYRTRAEQQQTAVQNRGTYGEAEVQRRIERTEAAARALGRAERDLRRAEAALRRLLGSRGGGGPYR